MGKIIRILITIVVVLSFVLVARSEAAWAANPGSDLSGASQLSVSPDKHDHCHGKDKDKKDCDDDDDDDDDGTVKPPRRRAKSCKLGTFSVGGAATVQIKRLARGDCVIATSESYNPQAYPPIPSGKRIMSPVVSVNLPKKGALVKVCMAAPPGKGTGLYKTYQGKWESVGSVKNGRACTETSKSGTYILLQ
jgi:hypothetical protein